MRTDAFDTPLLDSSSWRTLARRHTGTLGGLGLLAFAALAIAALATWSVNDPSLSHATSAPVTNMLGAGGAIFADLVMQILGLGGVLALVPIALWAWHLISEGALDRKSHRGLHALVLTVAGCAALAALPLMSGWPLPIGLGGLVGDVLIALPKALLPIPYLPQLLVAAVAVPIALIALSRATYRPVVQAPARPSDLQIKPKRIHRANGESFDTDHDDSAWDDDRYEGVGPDELAIDEYDEGSRSRIGIAMGYMAHIGYAGVSLVKRWMPGRRYPRIKPDLTELNANLRAAGEPEAVMPRADLPVQMMAPTDRAHPSTPARQPHVAPSQSQVARHDIGTMADDPLLYAFDEDGPIEGGWADPTATDRPNPNPRRPARMPSPRPQPAAVAYAPAQAPARMPRPIVEPHAEAVQEPEPSPEPAAYVHSADHATAEDWDRFEPAPPHEAVVPPEFAENPALPLVHENPAAYVEAPVATAARTQAASVNRPSRGPAAQRQTVPVADIVRPKKGKRAAREAQPSLLGEGEFELPPLHLLSDAPRGQGNALAPQALERNAGLLEGVLEDFRVTGEIVNVCPGPVVTLYEFEPAPGIKSARVIGLADDIARSMSAISARVAVIPGRNAIGIELPNSSRETVYLSEILGSQNFEKAKGNLPLTLGKTIGGEPVIADLARMPHLLVAGTTGSGKSVAINTMILSILYRWTPQECRLILIDPKMLELSVYDGIPHLLTPVVTDPNKAVVALKWAVREMEDRYRKMSKLGVRNIDGFNSRIREAERKGEVISRTVQTGFDQGTGEPVYEREELSYESMPMLVIVVDEMADLMMVAGKDIEGAIQRLAQMARAAGIHIIMATQRPSVDVITGTIKANFPTRCSFQVTSKIDSRTILGEQGAEQLLGQGDMLFMAGGGRIQRVHGPFVSDEEVEAVVDHLKAQGVPEYLHDITEEADDDDGDEGGDPTSKSIARLSKSDDPYEQAIAIVMRDKKASTSYVQRRLGIGYNRAASIIERMEKEGLIGPANHAGKREVLMDLGDDDAGFGD
ncbi:MAG: DNA translocase FtsK 4TM domain-containing protein [Pseudomonadota bacterium]